MDAKVCLEGIWDELAQNGNAKNLMQSDVEVNPNPIRYNTKVISLFEEDAE